MSIQSSTMNIILYAAENSPQVEQLQQVIALHLPKDGIEACQTVESLSLRIRQPLPNPVIFILLISSSKELSEILNLRSMLLDRRVILILPNDSTETLAMGHALRPRFLTYADEGFVDVSTVLGRMIAFR